MTLRDFVRRHPVACYFGLAYALSWLAWSPLIAASRGWIAPVSSQMHYLGSHGPLLSAIILTAMLDGWAGLRDLFARMFRWRVGVIWLIVVGLLSPYIVFTLSAVAARVGGAPWPDWHDLGRNPEFPTLGLAGIWLLELLTFGFGEETGWRGFALPRLQHGRSALGATALLTLGWAIWHLPSFLYRPMYSSMSAGMFVGWLVSLFLGAVVLTWMYNSTRGSILVVALWHASLDAVYVARAAQGNVAVIFSALIMVWGLFAIAVAGPRHLSRRGRPANPPGLESRNPAHGRAA